MILISIYWKDMHYLATKRIIARSKRLRDNYPEEDVIIIDQSKEWDREREREREREKQSIYPFSLL